MTRVKSGKVAKARHKKVLKQAKGYRGSKSTLYRTAHEQVMRSGNYAFRDRKNKKREFRKLWITRINAACREHDMSYSRFIEGLTKAGVEVNRKMLSELAIHEPKAFEELIKVSKEGLKKPVKKAETKTVGYKVVEPVKKETKPAAKKETAKKEEAKPAAKKTTTKKADEKPAPKKETAKKA